MEWRARRLRDPVERLQFLQSKIFSEIPAAPERKWRIARFPTFAAALALTLVSATMLQPFAKRALGLSPPPATPRSITPAVFNTKTDAPPADAPHVWIVENNPHFDLYSNGLRVENEFATSNSPRKYPAFRADRPDSPAEWRTEPAGIVFHTTESHIAPFEEDQNRTLKQAGESLLEYVRRRKSYHFVIDRFGRVFRIVRESDSAYHAGNSVWADSRWVYVYLNESFFGIAFEAQSKQDGESRPANAAQIHAARILTEMLRARYQIPASNCVAHAQVSVNPSNRRAGYHTDWAANLPFADLGLTDNYARPLASMTLFGFEADAGLAELGGAALARGIDAGENQIQADAAAHGLPTDRYRASLQKRYRDTIQMLRGKNVYQENNP